MNFAQQHPIATTIIILIIIGVAIYLFNEWNKPKVELPEIDTTPVEPPKPLPTESVLRTTTTTTTLPLPAVFQPGYAPAMNGARVTGLKNG